MSDDLMMDVSEIRSWIHGVDQALETKKLLDPQQLEHIKVLALLAIAEKITASEKI